MRRCSPRMTVAAMLIALASAGPAWARSAELKLRDGRTITGELVSQTDQAVTVAINGINATFARDQIQSIEVRLSVKEEYDSRRAQIKEDDLAGRYELARWLHDRKTSEGYGLALIELNAVLKADPEHLQAKLLRNIVQREVVKIAQEAQPKPEVQPAAVQPPVQPAVEPAPAPAPAQPAARPVPGPRPGNLLTEEQINTIKVYEVNLDAMPTVIIPPTVVNELFETYRQDPLLGDYLNRDGQTRFRRLAGWEQLGILFDLRARELYPKVTVQDLPEPLLNYRQRIYPRFVLGYLAREFSQGDDPVLPLITLGSTRDDVAFTNYLILHRGQIGGKPLIDRVNPVQSLIIQWALPRDEAVHPAPENPRWRPFFTGTDDPRLVEISDWINSLWGELEDYPFDYELPAALRPPAPQPAAQPQRQPAAPPQRQPAAAPNAPRRATPANP